MIRLLARHRRPVVRHPDVHALFERQIAELEAGEVDRQADETRLRIEAEVRNDLLDKLAAVRHRANLEHATPDTYFWGITTAERIVGGGS